MDPRRAKMLHVQVELRAGVHTASRAQPEGVLGHFRSAAVEMLIFPTVTRKTGPVGGAFFRILVCHGSTRRWNCGAFASSCAAVFGLRELGVVHVTVCPSG